MDDPYSVLGVARDASEDQIRRAYRRLAKQFHPDLNPGKAGAEERFKAISAANELLSDPEKRARYDRGEIDASGAERPLDFTRYRDFAEGRQGARYAAGNAGDADDIGDLFSDLFGGTGGGGFDTGGRPQFRMRGRDIRYVLPVDFLDAVNGATRRLQTPMGGPLTSQSRPGSRMDKCSASEAGAERA